jgi:hypothetical protein
MTFNGSTFMACYFLCLETKKVTPSTSSGQASKIQERNDYAPFRVFHDLALVLLWLLHLFFMLIYVNRFVLLKLVADNQGSTVIHHSNTKAKLKNPFRKRAVSFSEVFFGQAKKKGKTLPAKINRYPTSYSICK